MTLVGGKVIFENGGCNQINEGKAMKEAQARSAELIDRLNLSSEINPSLR